MFCSCGAAGMGTFSELVRKLLYSSSLLVSVTLIASIARVSVSYRIRVSEWFKTICWCV